MRLASSATAGFLSLLVRSVTLCRDWREVYRYQDIERELELQIGMKQEVEVAMRLLEKDGHDKQELTASLRKQLEDVKNINIEMHGRLQVRGWHFTHTPCPRKKEATLIFDIAAICWDIFTFFEVLSTAHKTIKVLLLLILLPWCFFFWDTVHTTNMHVHSFAVGHYLLCLHLSRDLMYYCLLPKCIKKFKMHQTAR